MGIAEGNFRVQHRAVTEDNIDYYEVVEFYLGETYL